jgi:hypothetical protein
MVFSTEKNMKTYKCNRLPEDPGGIFFRLVKYQLSDNEPIIYSPA